MLIHFEAFLTNTFHTLTYEKPSLCVPHCPDLTSSMNAEACTCTQPNPPLSPPLPPQEWEALQQSIQRRERALLETKSKVTHPVYSICFAEEKHEWWWLYIADRRDQTLVSMPYHVCTLKDTEEVSVCFLMEQWPNKCMR